MLLTESDRGPLLRWTNRIKPTDKTHKQNLGDIRKSYEYVFSPKNTTCKTDDWLNTAIAIFMVEMERKVKTVQRLDYQITVTMSP
jgi:hypothetical protein